MIVVTSAKQTNLIAPFASEVIAEQEHRRSDSLDTRLS
jgi:hypothetical protein